MYFENVLMKETGTSTNNLIPESNQLNSILNNNSNTSPTSTSNNNSLNRVSPPTNADLIHHSTSIRSISKFKDKA